MATKMIWPRMPTLGAQEWLMKSLFRFTSAAVAAPMKKPSAIWMKDCAVLPLTRASPGDRGYGRP